jgi:hypothetical protein
VQKTVEVHELLEVLLSNRPIVQSSVWVQLINKSDFYQLVDCVSNIIPLRVKFTTYKFMYINTLRTGIFFLYNNHKSLIKLKSLFLVKHALLPFLLLLYLSCN